MDNHNIYERIIKELSSENSVEEQKYLEQKLAKDPELEESYQIIKEYWNNFYPQNQPNNIIGITEKKLDFKYRQRTGIKTKTVYKLIASTIILLSLSYTIFHLTKLKPKQELNEYSCSAGEIKEITLSDGTNVWLNSMSLLIATEPFVGDKREVKLFGEAYFEVIPNPEKPFIVKTHLLLTEVLGTNFNVVAYPTDGVHEVALYKGKVQLNSESNVDNKIILKPGERAYFTTKTEKIDVVKTDLGKPAKWRDGILRFYDEDLFGITKKLERKFQTRILITDSIVGNLRYTAEFEEESLEKVLSLLSEAQEFNYNIKNNGIIIETNKQIYIDHNKAYTN